MTKVTNELLFEILKNVQSETSTIKDDLRDIKFRIGSLERATANVHDTQVHHSGQFDRMTERLERIENRLNLVEA